MPTSSWLQRKSQGINKGNSIHCQGTQDLSLQSRYVHRPTLLAYLQNFPESKQCLVLYYTETHVVFFFLRLFFHFRNKQWNWPQQFRNSFHLSRLKESGEVAEAEIGYFREGRDRRGFHQPVTDQASWQVSVSLYHISEELIQLSFSWWNFSHNSTDVMRAINTLYGEGDSFFLVRLYCQYFFISTQVGRDATVFLNHVRIQSEPQHMGPCFSGGFDIEKAEPCFHSFQTVMEGEKKNGRGKGSGGRWVWQKRNPGLLNVTLGRTAGKLWGDGGG